jgi:hypothetical protein
MEWRKTLLCILLGIFLISFSPVQIGAKTFEDSSVPAKSGLVVLSAFASPPYSVCKLTYALSGSVVAGAITVLSLGFALDAATTVGTQAVNGDWIIYPTVFTGERKVEFVGRDVSVEGLVLTMDQEQETP